MSETETMYQNKDTMRRPERQAADAGGSVLQSAAEPYRAHMCHGRIYCSE